MPDPRAPLRRLILTTGVLVVAVVSPLLLLQWFPIDARLPGTISRTPLRPAETGEGPRFAAISPEQSGLTFRNVLDEHNRYQYLTNGSGLAVGDYDNDGWPDLYLVSQDGPNKLFRQTAPLVFEDVTVASGGLDGGQAWGAGASFTDIDNDGLLDLYVCNLEAKNLLYRNLGDGRFVECAAEHGLDIAAASTMAAFCDFDRDGDLDLYLLTNRSLHPQWAQTPEVLEGIRAPADSVRPPSEMTASLDELRNPVLGRLQSGQAGPEDEVPEALAEHFMYSNGLLHAAGQPDRLLRNDDGFFVDVTTRAGIADQGMGLSASWCDYDRDGWPDLYVANDLESPDILWRNLGDGTFRDVTDQCLPHTAYFGMGSDWGDFDNDGNIDLFVADMSATTHRMSKILMGDMSTQREFLIRSRPQQYMRNALLHNTGTERFQELAYLAGVASTDWTWSCLFGDLDCDGRLDLFCTNGIARFDMNPDISLRVRELYQQRRYQDMVRVIQTIPSVPERNIALRNEGDLKFQAQGSGWGLDFEGVSHGAALVDLDRDGDLDVVTNNYNAPVGLWENLTAAPNALAVALHGFESNRFGIGARLELTTGSVTQTRENWLSRGYLSGQEPRVVFGLGDHTHADRLVIRWPSGHVQEL
ncbi:MAG: CRTAC1 family protein, partial [Planctomycetota bacterium]|nr:CRTAC1 family protein [Planctomycetota bacterium]